MLNAQVKVRSTIGQFLQVGFSTMSSTALVPLVCYSHPSGQRSNFKNPNIICGSESHTVMVIFGSLLLVFGFLKALKRCEEFMRISGAPGHDPLH